MLHSTSAAAVILKLRRHFSVHGAPHTLMSDNAGQFTSQRFKDFAKQWDVQHITSNPEYPQSNGLAEHAVKQALEKSSSDGSDILLDLLNLRNIPRDSTLDFPAQRLMSRQSRTTLPVSKKLLQPRVYQPQVGQADSKDVLRSIQSLTPTVNRGADCPAADPEGV